jgi:hypothetical protein
VTQEVVFTATVTPGVPGANMPTGIVTFRDGATTLGTGTLDPATGIATFAISTLAVGDHPITAVYEGDANFLTSTSTVLTQTVSNLQISRITLIISPNPVTVGQSVLFISFVSGDTGSPTGTVTFKDGATVLGTIPLNGTLAIFSISTLAVGDHEITAVYNGDNNFAGSVSPTVRLTVRPLGFSPAGLRGSGGGDAGTAAGKEASAIVGALSTGSANDPLGGDLLDPEAGGDGPESPLDAAGVDHFFVTNDNEEQPPASPPEGQGPDSTTEETPPEGLDFLPGFGDDLLPAFI